MQPHHTNQQLPLLRTHVQMLLKFPRCGLAAPEGWQHAALGDVVQAVAARLRQHDADPLSRVKVPPQNDQYWHNEAVEHVVIGGDGFFSQGERQAIAERLQGRPHLVPHDWAFGPRLVALAGLLRKPLTAQQRAALRHEKGREELWLTLDQLKQAAGSMSPDTLLLVPVAFDPRLVRHGLAETRAAIRARR